MKAVLQLLGYLLIAVLIVGAILFFVQPATVQQKSMEDTFHENDMLIVSRRAYKKNPPQRGDVIVFESDLESNGSESLQKVYKGRLLIKRVIGIPGDEITLSDHEVYVNGELQEEPYVKGETPTADNPYDGETVTVPDGQYYVMGDNRENSLDSRDSEVGFVPGEVIIGKVVLELYPDIKKIP